MTEQIKFGDWVRFLLTGQVGIIGQVGNKNEKWVVHFEDGDTGFFSSGFLDQIEVIPHPDTVRLDWLAKNDCALTEKLCDEDGDILDVPFGVIQIEERHFEVLAAASDIRAAIDAAMQHETNHE